FARNVQRLEILETAEGREVVVRHVNGVFNHRTGYHTRRFREYDSRFPQPLDGGAVVGRRRRWFSGDKRSDAKQQGDEQHRLERSIIDRHGVYSQVRTNEKWSGTVAGTARRVLRTTVPDPFSSLS